MDIQERKNVLFKPCALDSLENFRTTVIVSMGSVGISRHVCPFFYKKITQCFRIVALSYNLPCISEILILMVNRY